MKIRRSFEEGIEHGNGGELEVMDILVLDGCSVITTFDYKNEQKSKPIIHTNTGEEISPPDLDCFKNGKRFWVEVKRYSYSPYNRTFKCNVHGIKKHQYKAYLKTQELSGCPVWLAIWEAQNHRKHIYVQNTDVILWALMHDLKPLPCLCRNCAAGVKCCNRSPLVYFDRRQFRIIPEWQRSHHRVAS